MADEEEAREVLQDVFTSLVSEPRQFGGKSSLLTWLYSATTHRCLNRLRDTRNRRRILQDNLRPASSVSAGAETRAVVRNILAHVPDDLAQVAIYYYLDELTQAEIAGVLACSRRHVGDLLERFHDAVGKVEAAG